MALGVGAVEGLLAPRLHDELLLALAGVAERVPGGEEGVLVLAEDGDLGAAVVAAQPDAAAAGAVGLVLLRELKRTVKNERNMGVA